MTEVFIFKYYYSLYLVVCDRVHLFVINNAHRHQHRHDLKLENVASNHITIIPLIKYSIFAL